MQEPRSTRVVVLGERGVGKSSFLSALTGCALAPTAQQPTFAVLPHDGALIELVECTTHADYAAGRDLLLNAAHGWVVLYSSGSKTSLARAREWERLAATKHVPVLLLGVLRHAPPSTDPALPLSLPLTFALSDLVVALRPSAPIGMALASLFARCLARHHNNQHFHQSTPEPRRLVDVFGV